MGECPMLYRSSCARAEVGSRWGRARDMVKGRPAGFGNDVVKGQAVSPCARRVLAVLSDEFATPIQIAVRARLPTRARTAIARKMCEALERQGLAEREGTPDRPRWRIAATRADRPPQRPRAN